MIEGSMSMKRDEPLTLLYVAEPGAEPGAEAVRLEGPMKPAKVDAALERALAQGHCAVFVLAVCDAT